jgi:hypothetical protein
VCISLGWYFLVDKIGSFHDPNLSSEVSAFIFNVAPRISFLLIFLFQDTAESLKSRVQALEGAAFIEAVRLFAAHTLSVSQQQRQ